MDRAASGTPLRPNKSLRAAKTRRAAYNTEKVLFPVPAFSDSNLISQVWDIRCGGAAAIEEGSEAKCTAGSGVRLGCDRKNLQTLGNKPPMQDNDETLGSLELR